jgi:hypothetical protein
MAMQAGFDERNIQEKYRLTFESLGSAGKQCCGKNQSERRSLDEHASSETYKVAGQTPFSSAHD